MVTRFMISGGPAAESATRIRVLSAIEGSEADQAPDPRHPGGPTIACSFHKSAALPQTRRRSKMLCWLETICAGEVQVNTLLTLASDSVAASLGPRRLS